MIGRIGFVMLVIALFSSSGGVLADGILLPVERPHSIIVVPDELFTVKYHHVDVTINNQLCETRVDQIFHNDTSVDREGMYIFPMPDGSAITRFSMYAGEDEIVGKILGKDEARGIYESIVRQRKDPALLEYIDRNTFRARVYPIPANGDKRIRLNYSEVAGKFGSTYRYVYPLSTERFSARPLEDCRVTIKITAKRPITNVYSPTHVVQVDHFGDREATVTWSAANVKPDTDLVLYYSLSDDDLGIDLVTHREADQKGYYMLLASPRVDLDKAKVQPKNVVFVLDRTGSMAGAKIDQARGALKFCLNSLRETDQFNLITFNESTNALFAELEKPTKEHMKRAMDAIDAIDATGGTNINEALTKALAEFRQYGQSRNYIVFLTDGLPTVGMTNLETILNNAASANGNNVKVFAFGVGYDVNTHLLDRLAEQNKGTADYVRPKEDIEVKVSSFFAKVSEPLLADVSVSISGVKTSDAFPSAHLPDIFRGSRIIILGRFDGSGKAHVRLTGTASGSRKVFEMETTIPETEGSNEFIPQLWAARKIGYLLDEIRLHSNQELIEEVVRLSKEFGIPTEYTSFFADDRKLVASQELGVDRARAYAFKADSVQTGSHAVAQSSNNRAMKDQAQLPQAAPMPTPGGAAPQVIGKAAANGRMGGAYFDANDQLVAVANVQNVARRTFYQRGDFWEDTGVKPDQKFVQIKQFSDAHFKLLAAYPKLSQYSTLGNLRFTLENNQAIEIGPQGKTSMSHKEIEELLKGIVLDRGG